jgi:MFS superfamily sulfate permease-like transporter
MPFRNLHLWVLGLLALTLLAFWPSYLSQLPAGKQAWHVHAASALLWTGLVIIQSWSIHSGQRALHRYSGYASFALFPLFLVGGMMAIQAEAITLAKDPAAPENLVIAQFGFFDPLANIGFALLYFGGLKHRRNVHLHARYMMATLLFLVAPVIWRLLQVWVPIFNSDTPETAYRFSYAMAAGNAGAILLTYGLYRQAPKHGRPFLIAIAFVAAQQLLFETAGRLEAWAPVFAKVADADPALLLLATGLASVLLAWFGWRAGKRSEPAAPSPGA